MSIAERSETTQSLVTIKADMNALATIEGIVSECSLDALRDANQFVRTMKLAAGVGALRRIITNEMMADIMMLQGCRLGFRTDKDREGGYPINVVKDCMIEHVLKGGYMVGNELNIIAGNTYCTKEFYTRKLREFPGLSDLRIVFGVPVMKNGGALVSATATWKLNGVADHFERIEHSPQDDNRIPVKVNSQMGADAILGKAERKMKKSIYDYLTGSETFDGEVGESMESAPELPQVKTLDALADRLTGDNGAEASNASTESKPAESAESTPQAASSTPETEWPLLQELVGKLVSRNSKASVIALQEAWVSNHPQHAEAIRHECGNRIGQLKEAQKQQELIK